MVKANHPRWGIENIKVKAIGVNALWQSSKHIATANLQDKASAIKKGSLWEALLLEAAKRRRQSNVVQDDMSHGDTGIAWPEDPMTTTDKRLPSMPIFELAPMRRKYILDAVLGQGVDGTVYRAINTFDDTAVAVKISVAKYRHGEWDLPSKMEVSLLLACQSPHVVAVRDAFVNGGISAHVMPLADETLHSIVCARGMLGDSEVAALSCQMFSALAVLTKRSVVHRDIPSQNILVASCDPFRACLADLGRACYQRDELATHPNPLYALHTRPPEFIFAHDALWKNDNSSVYTTRRVLANCFASDMWAMGAAVVNASLRGKPIRGVLGGSDEWEAGQALLTFLGLDRVAVQAIARKQRWSIPTNYKIASTATFGDPPWASKYPWATSVLKFDPGSRARAGEMCALMTQQTSL